jgi:hypothetical protein
MNVRRGLWRIWIFLTVLWVIGTAALAYMIMPDSLTAGHVNAVAGSGNRCVHSPHARESHLHFELRPYRRELFSVAPSRRMTERGQSNHVTMAWQSDSVVGRNVLTTMVWQGHILRGCNIVRA